MRDIPEFRIDRWIQAQASKVKIPLHGSNVGAWSLSELQQLAPDEPILDYDLLLTYGTSAGSLKLRERIAALYSSPESGVTLNADNVVVTPGSIMANYLALTNIAGPGDHVICMYPTFSQLFVVPRFQGAEVSLWHLRRREDGSGWDADLDELRAMLRPETRAIIINNPNNPTGAILPLSTLQSLLTLTTTTHPKLTLYSDEVFHPLFHSTSSSSSPPPPSLISLPSPASSSSADITPDPSGKSTPPRILVTGSVSKTIGLPGIRVGWIVCTSSAFLHAQIMKSRDYTTISVSQLDDAVAAFALSPQVLPRMLEQSHALCARSIDIITEWVARNKDRLEWTPPAGAGTAFVRVKERHGGWVDDQAFARRVIEHAGVSVVPGGHCFGDGEDEEWKGYVRISLGKDESVLRQGLKLLEDVLRGF